MREKEIPEENIVNFIDTGKGIIPFPLTIPFNWCVKSRKQVNLFKISSSTSNLFQDPILQERKEERKKTWKCWGMLVIGGSFISPLFFPLDNCPEE